MPALYPGQYLLTKEQFPELSMLHPRLLDTPPRPMCLGQYWIAYVRAGSVLAVDCIKSQPVSVIVTIIQYVGTWFPSFQGQPLISGAMPLESGAGFA